MIGANTADSDESKTSNHYYNLPDEVIEKIESDLKIKPKELQKLIENPPKKYQVMLKSYLHSELPGMHLTQKQIDDVNKEIKEININLIKFFIKYDVKAEKDISNKKARIHGLIRDKKEPHTRVWERPDGRSRFDHVRQFITNDKKHIIISSPYSDDEETAKEHFKYNFKRYPNNLYNDGSYTFYLILDKC